MCDKVLGSQKQETAYCTYRGCNKDSNPPHFLVAKSHLKKFQPTTMEIAFKEHATGSHRILNPSSLQNISEQNSQAWSVGSETNGIEGLHKVVLGIHADPLKADRAGRRVFSY